MEGGGAAFYLSAADGEMPLRDVLLETAEQSTLLLPFYLLLIPLIIAIATAY